MNNDFSVDKKPVKQKAVSLKYPDGADAPYISASCEGKAAERMIQIARDNRIPVVQNENLANVLYLQNVGDFIPEETFVVVAKIFAFMAKLDKGGK